MYFPLFISEHNIKNLSSIDKTKMMIKSEEKLHQLIPWGYYFASDILD
jgi:hypothetical protein